jgi:hypothetical protein
LDSLSVFKAVLIENNIVSTEKLGIGMQPIFPHFSIAGLLVTICRMVSGHVVIQFSF